MFIGHINELTSDRNNTLAEHIKVYWLFSKMPESYRLSIPTILHTTAEADLTLDNVKPKLKLEDLLWNTSIGQANKISKPKTKPKPPCSHCSKDNHDPSNCYKKFPEKNPRNKKKDSKGKDSGLTNQGGNGNQNGQNHTHTISSLVPVSSTVNKIAASFYKASLDVDRANLTIRLMDSGASQHVTGCFEDLTEYQKYDKPKFFKMAQSGDSGRIEGLGEGIVKGYTMVDG